MNRPTRSAPLLGPMHRVLSWIRAALVVHAIVVNAQRLDHVAHPAAMVLVCVVMVVWSIVMALWNSVLDPWRTQFAIADLVLSLGLLMLTPWVLGSTASSLGDPAVTVYWHAAAATTAAMYWGSWWGLVAAIALLAGRTLTTSGSLTERIWASGFAACVAAWGVGQMVAELRTSLEERDRSMAASMALAERDRMNRIVHDGALQVLSLVEREGRSMGPRGQRLAQLARQQEIALRSLLQDRTVDFADEEPGEIDITAMLDAMNSERVTVSMMAGAVMMPVEVAHELKAAIGQILLNTELHAGPEAHSWMLLEESDEAIIISVRDNGVGMTSEQVREAFDSGRLGIKESIIGRIQDLGGTAEVTSSPGRGVEWELQVPRDMRPTASLGENRGKEGPDG